VVDLASGAKTAQLLPAAVVAISRDAVVVATPEGKLQTPVKPSPPSNDPWNIAINPDGNLVGEHGSRVTALRYSPDGRTLAAGGSDGRISLWSDGKLLGKLDGHVAAIHALAWSADGLQLASTADDGTIVWDLHP
jgi:WD40 repeat protein